VPKDVRDLIRLMSQANPLWGAPRIHGELLKVGVDVCQATVAKYMVRHRHPPSQTWRTFLATHLGQITAADFFVVPTATCRLLFVLVIMAHERRRIVHVAVTDHPTAAWTRQQLREAFPWEEAPRYLVRDRDHAFAGWAETAKTMRIDELLTAPRSPWQNAYAERFIGSARRECLDHVIVFSATGLQRLMTRYCAYYNHSRTHLALNKDAPIHRPSAAPADGLVVAIPQVGGLPSPVRTPRGLSRLPASHPRTHAPTRPRAARLHSRPSRTTPSTTARDRQPNQRGLHSSEPHAAPRAVGRPGFE
jgi:putative transposase